MRVSLTSFVVVSLSVLVGLLAGRTLTRERASSSAHPQRMSASNAVPLAVRSLHARPTKTLSRAALRAEIDAAMARHLPHAPVSAQEGAADDSVVASRPVTAAQKDAAADGEALVDASVARGTWTREDRLALLGLTPKLHGDDLYAVMVRVSAAVNRGDVIPDNGPVF